MIRFTAVLLMTIVIVGLVSAQAPTPETVKLAISGMSCNSCVTKVDKALRDVKGVKDVKVDLKSESAEVVLASASVKSDALVKAVVKAGFKAHVGKKPAAAKGEKEEGCCPEEDGKKEGACDRKCEQEAKDKKKPTGKS
jgi:copper chaperone CopZ